jgi:anti-sigma factor ChrR (cupin superfamily)
MNTHQILAATNDMDMGDRADAALTLALLAEGLSSVQPAAEREHQLHQRLQQRVGRSAIGHRGMRTLRKSDQQWKTLSKGVRACVLNDNGIISSALIEFDPGTRLPGHRHLAHEECVVLRGSLNAGDLVVGPHDYHLAPYGSKHPSIGSEEGALIFLRGTSLGSGMRMMRELVSAWLPGRGAAPSTVRADYDNWHSTGDGAQIKPLWINGDVASMLVNIEPGGRLPGYTHAQDEECLMISGEAFLGDILLRSGEYQMAPSTTVRSEITSDVGGLLFIHTTAALATLS